MPRSPLSKATTRKPFLSSRADHTFASPTTTRSYTHLRLNCTSRLALEPPRSTASPLPLNPDTPLAADMSTCNPSGWAPSVSYALQKTRYVSLSARYTLLARTVFLRTRVGHESQREDRTRGQLTHSIAFFSPEQLTGTMVAVKKM